MLTIRFSENDKRPDIEKIKDHEVVMLKEIINAVCDAIDKNIPTVVALYFEIPGQKDLLEIKLGKSVYKLELMVGIKILAEVEEYEYCAKAHKYIKILDAEEERFLLNQPT
jgi:hypothetical protein